MGRKNKPNRLVVGFLVGEVPAGRWPRGVTIESQLHVFFLARKVAVGDGLGGGGAGAAEGVVGGFGVGDLLADLPAATVSES